MSPKILMYLIIATVLLALVTAVILLSVPFRGQPESSADPTPVALEQPLGQAEPVPIFIMVGDQQVTLQVEPDKLVTLLPLAGDVAPVVDVAPTAEPLVVEQPTAETVAAEPPPPTAEPLADPATPTPIPVVVPPPAVAPSGRVNLAVEAIIFNDYVVVAQDTLFGLTTKHTTSIELMARYGISSTSLVVGATIRLPVANPQRCPAMRPYIVREKDTVFRIANEYGTTPNILRDVNALNEAYRIDVAQVLCIP